MSAVFLSRLLLLDDCLMMDCDSGGQTVLEAIGLLLVDVELAEDW